MNLTTREKAAYGLGAVGKDMVYCIVSGFLMYYYNTVLGISATFVGVLFMVARALDAVNDPFMGIIVEKTNTRMGKFRPWLLIGTVLSAISLYGMYAVPRSLTGTPLLIYASAAYILWGTTYTLMDIPYWSMIPAISQNGKDRENISVIARSCAGFGFAIPTALTMVLVPVLGKGDERTGFQVFAGMISIFFIVAISITVMNVKEKTKPQLHSPRIKEMFQALFRNDQALAVVITIVIFNASIYLTSQLAVYFFKYDIGNSALYGIFGTVGGATQILSMTLLPIFRKKWDRKKIFTGAILTAIFGYGILFTLGTLKISNLVFLCIAAVIIYFGFGLATVLTTVFLADSVDYGEWKTKQRSESVIFSMQTFVVQLASAFSALIAGVGIDLIKLDINAPAQTASTLQGMRFFMIIIPMVGLLLSILFFRRKYKLSEETMGQILTELKDREEQ
ncbi:MAG: sugar (Glycoside-Pentoside-Hexuronide) transporter [Firmicutes bacterium]|nr:sugar (Glycoside-Pentoside-Hexuronide) transporter [Bacillota bacterium]